MGREARDTKLRRVAAHEAGHAVAAVRGRCGLRHVTVVEGEDNLGHSLNGGLPGSLDRAIRLGFPTPAETRRAEDWAVTMLAGPAAERALAGRGRWNWVSARGDLENVTGLALALNGDERSTNRWVDEMLTRAVAFADEHQPEIEAVADALAERGTLTGREVRAIVNSGVDVAGAVGRATAQS